jgi:hypothetical protein
MKIANPLGALVAVLWVAALALCLWMLVVAFAPDRACARRFCYPTPCYTSGICQGDCVCYKPGGGPGRCVSVEN